MDGTENLAPKGFDPQTVQSVAYRSTNYATTSAYFNITTLKCRSLQMKVSVLKNLIYTHKKSSQHRPNVFKKRKEINPLGTNAFQRLSISASFPLK
jgi:hypothetical protein